jgi:hypothetical protein
MHARGVLRPTSRVVIAVTITCTLISIFYLTRLSPLPTFQWNAPDAAQQDAVADADNRQPTEIEGSADPSAPPCQSLKHAEDIVVVMRTGATEIKDKLPVHINTTFTCYPDILIYSDYAEVFQGYEVHDVLAGVNEELKQSNEDFRHYLHLQQVGREGLSNDELHGESYESGPVGKNDNPGWVLDKWKFLPMMAETLQRRPDKQWFLFVEPDTYVVWSNLLLWLQRLDPSKPLYYGSEVQIGTDLFAHGGTGFILSRPALERVAQDYEANADDWHARTANHWAGDCILGMALKAAGVSLTWSWPMWQGGNPADMNWTEKKGRLRLWCSPVLSFHHFAPYEVKGMWWYEQEHIRAQQTNDWRSTPEYPQILHHWEVFRRYVLPNMTEERDGWSNQSPGVVPDSKGMGMDECRAACEARHSCLQYTLDSEGCSISEIPKMGSRAEKVQSGWLVDRIQTWADRVGKPKSCRGSAAWTVT